MAVAVVVVGFYSCSFIGHASAPSYFSVPLPLSLALFLSACVFTCARVCARVWCVSVSVSVNVCADKKLRSRTFFP